MTAYRAHHDHTSCPLCEPGPLEGFCRHWKVERKVGAWHIMAEGPDLMQRLVQQAHFVTVLAYRPAAEGGPAHYRGPLYWEGDAHDPADVLKDMRCCIELLQVEYDCRPESIRTWLSGGRSLHVTIPPKVIGAEQGHPLLPQIYAAMIEQLFPHNVAPTLDRGIYSGGKGRMWRLVNRQRSDTGRYKIPVTMQEVLHKPYADLEALTLSPRKGMFWPAEEDFSRCPGLVQLYQETAAAVERAASVCPHCARDASPRHGDVDVLLSRCAFLRHCRDDAATLPEPEWYSMVSNVARCRHGAEAVHRLSAPYPGYSPQETEEKIAHALADAGPHTCAFIQALEFQGCPPGGCGVKAPIGLSRPSWHKSIAGGQSYRRL
jgi:putative DNA primase/helicase